MCEVFRLRWHQLNTFQGAGKADKTWLHGWHVTVSHARRCLASRLTWWPWPSPRPEWPSLTSAAPPRVKVCVLPPGIPGSGARGHADETIPPQWGSSQFCLLCHFSQKMSKLQHSNHQNWYLKGFWATLSDLIASMERPAARLCLLLEVALVSRGDLWSLWSTSCAAQSGARKTLLAKKSPACKLERILLSNTNTI